MAAHSRIRLMVTVLVIGVVGVMAGGCSNESASSPPTIVPADEPGPRLTVEGRVLDATTGEPIPGAQLVVYQTDQAGTYQPEDPSDESTARIRGDLTTDGDGRFGFVTVQPGEYPDQPPGNRHIHFHSVAADGYESRGFVLLFDDNVRRDVRTWAESTGFGIVVPVGGEATTGMAVSVDIELEPQA